MSKKARAAAARFFRLPQSKRAQDYFEFLHLYGHPDVIGQLVATFLGKCAFCETLLEESRHETLHYRPMCGTVGANGRYYADHYWWLAYDWSNLYLACIECFRMKGSRFPVAGKRAKLNSDSESLQRERPLLLDPCAEEPAASLVFTAKGTVAGRDERGQATIEILGLNRHDLVIRRREAAIECSSRLKDVLVMLQTENPVHAQAMIAALLAPELEFSALRQQLVANWAAKLPRRAIVALRQQQAPTAIDRHEEAVVVENTLRFQREVDNVAIDAGVKTKRAFYFARARYIERVEIETFRGLTQLTIDVHSGDGDTAPWTVLLGENGTGKSSVLQAMSLALMSAKYRDRLPIAPSEFVQNDASEAVVRVFLAGSSTPIELTIRGGRTGRFEATSENQQLLLLAYGSTRLLPRRTGATLTTSVRPSTVARVKNLFDPFAPLLDAEHWLLRLPSRQFDIAGRTIRLLLGLATDGHLTRERSSLYITTGGRRVSLHQLSDGYQSMVATACDIMSVLFTYWADVSVAEAVVLLDEIEAHLHPRWKLAIITAFRRAFPRLQFFVTTHDPLCLRGADGGEIIVLRRLRDGIKPLTDLPPSRLLGVDQLLTSDLFGMNSTFDPTVEVSFARYYDLLAATSRTSLEEAELAQLGQWLFENVPLGDFPREQVVIRMIDEYLAGARQTVDPAERARLFATARDAVVAVWNDVSGAKSA